MKLNINNEFGQLRSVVVCWGKNIPKWEGYKNNDPEFIKYHQKKWDNQLLLKQQDNFFKVLQKYGVELIFPNLDIKLTQQMYTRDTAFVVGNKLCYSKTRKFLDRNGEEKCLLEALELNSDQIVVIDNEIEGGDVLVSGPNSVYIGCGSRTHQDAHRFLEQNNIKTKVFNLGDKVMHLDTRMTLLPRNYALVNTSCLSKTDFEYLTKVYKIIEVEDQEASELGTNVFMVDPDTIIVAKQHQRIVDILKDLKFNVEIIDYSEPINLSGSFRCTTMPLNRED